MGIRLYVDPGGAGHDPGPGVPDRPSRIDACLEAIAGASIEAEKVEPPDAPREALARVHEGAYLDWLESFCASGGGEIDPGTSAGPLSFRVASRAAGACCDAVDAALERGVRSFCLTRPPGHHATPDRAMGFCLLNQVAVAAGHAVARGADRVLILDIDVHHGNGTQEVFWRDPRVLYVSLHQWPWYPWRSGALDEIGEGPGAGTTVNIPLPAMTGDAVYLSALERVVAPVARAFSPDLMLVSAGYDAHEKDPLSLMDVTSEGFGLMAAMIGRLAEEVCGGRLVLSLEGGYHPAALGASVAATLASLLRPAPADAAELSESFPFSDHALERVVAFHERRWRTA